MWQVFMTLSNKGLVEFCFAVNGFNNSALRVNYKVHTRCDAEAVREEFCRAIAQTLSCVVSDEGQEAGLGYLYLLPVASDDSMIETIVAA